jgi:NAD(P)-dependent dehydrogenase (short-subunit alcohol dehydrogenase family)
MAKTTTIRVALVTGANRGIGLETARQLLAAGLRVVLAGRDQRATESARRGLGAAAASDGSSIAVRLDVTDAPSIEAAAKTIRERWGSGVDVLINHAAVLLDENSDVLSIPAAGFRSTLDTNLLGAIEACRVFVPPMAERGWGRVVNVSSGAGQISTMATYAPAYSISKAALNAFTRVLAATYRGRGVLANCVDPGWVRTDMGGSSAPRSVEEGAATIVWLATLPARGPSGGFFRDRRPIDW